MSVDLVTMSYALSMIPNFYALIDRIDRYAVTLLSHESANTRADDASMMAQFLGTRWSHRRHRLLRFRSLRDSGPWSGSRRREEEMQLAFEAFLASLVSAWTVPWRPL
jgi:hypothetical protein